MHPHQCTPGACSLLHNPNIPQKSHWQVKVVGEEMHQGFTRLHPISSCVSSVGVHALRMRAHNFLLQAHTDSSCKAWREDNARVPMYHPTPRKHQAEQHLGFGSVFPFRWGCAPPWQVAAVCSVLPFVAPAMTNCWPCGGRDPGEPQQRHQMLFMAPAKLLHLRHPNYFKFKTQLWKARLSCSILPIAPMRTGLAFQTTALLRG